MDFNDRRPGAGQLDIFGGEHTPAPEPPAPSPEAKASIVRQGKSRSQRSANQSALTRRSDRASFTRENNPITGLPARGPLSPWRDIGMQEDYEPSWASYQGSAPSARLKYGKVKEIPIQDADGPRIGTGQPDLSSVRLHEQMAHPETRSNPRLGRTEYPDVYESPYGEHTVIDGNHRMAGALMRNEMFQPANVLTDANKGDVQAHTARIEAHAKVAYKKEEGRKHDQKLAGRADRKASPALGEQFQNSPGFQAALGAKAKGVLAGLGWRRS